MTFFFLTAYLCVLVEMSFPGNVEGYRDDTGDGIWIPGRRTASLR